MPINQQQLEELLQHKEAIDNAMTEINRILKKSSPLIYERWKAGGKQVTDEFISGYPCLSEVIDRLENEDDYQKDDNEDEEEEN